MTRKAVVAGLFYPEAPDELAATVDALIDLVGREPRAGMSAFVTPHAGYAYSGQVAAAAFAIAPRAARVALLGPSHFEPLEGLAISSADAWATPLGEVPVSAELRAAAVGAGAVVDDAPHTRDHALEVQLPFLQRVCQDGLEILPVSVGPAPPEQIAEVIAALDALVVVSTDLSHDQPEPKARELDRCTADAVIARNPSALTDGAACGVHALRGLVEHARREQFAVELLDLQTSADATADSASVVGYGAFALQRT